MKIFLIFIIAVSLISSAGCAVMSGSGSEPTDSLKTFVSGLKGKDPSKVKSSLSKSSIQMLESGAKASDQTVDEFIKSGKASEGLKVEGEFRNEKIEGNTATVEAKSGDKWETIHLVKESGVWKVALDKN